MNKELLDIIENDFQTVEQSLVISKLKTLTVDDVMAKSQHNLDNTYRAILQLSQGNLNKLDALIAAAKIDFRDVIYWASDC